MKNAWTTGWGLVLALVFCLCPPAVSGTGDFKSLTAREAFLLLPSSVLENLEEGLSDYEKYELLSTGSSGNWLIRNANDDILELESLTDPESTVMLCLYRGESSLVAAMGSDFGPFCLTELWRMEGRGIPLDTPAEPHLTDFFQRDRRISPDISVSMTFCARPEGLEVKPQFWSSTGRARLRPDNAVFYIWTGKRFSKRIVPLYRPLLKEQDGDRPEKEPE